MMNDRSHHQYVPRDKIVFINGMQKPGCKRGPSPFSRAGFFGAASEAGLQGAVPLAGGLGVSPK